jgi:NAD(P)-dependent dehydrogenase (short-subunit alcohol dehydrogenase family)
MLQGSGTEENNMDRLKGKIVLITGGTSGIGAATARLFQAEGAMVIVTGASENSVNVARETMPGIEAVHSNAGDAQAAHQLVQFVAAKHRKIDVLFVNAGIARVAAAADTEERQFDELFATNVRGPYFLLRHAIPMLSEGASVILTSTISALRAVPGLSAYSASKAALRSLGITLAVELAPRKIRVNTITPGPINTPISGKMGLTPEQMAGFGEMIARVPLKRPGEAEEVAAAALYFASDDSRFTTGTELRIDGGLTLL